MRKIEFINLIRDNAKDYRKLAYDSINRNSHMNDLNGNCHLTQDQIDAILTDFINFIAMRHDMDYSMYVSDLI